MAECGELCYWVQLHAIPEMGPVTFRRLLDRFGSPRSVIEETEPEHLGEVSGVNRAMAEAIRRARNDTDSAEQTVELLLQRGVHLVRVTDAAYPAMLHDLDNPPPLLFMLGEVMSKDARSVAMVGATKPSDRGREIAEGFAARFAAQGITVVSGYAHGIDAASHRGAFKGGGRSILCVPYGIRQYRSRPDFPPLAELTRRGAVISECPPDEPWSSAAAIARDRLIAALGKITFVVEARPLGGTFHTVKAANRLQRPVFALQYRDAPESARGNAILIARGAAPITRYAEIGEMVDCLGQ